MLYPNWGYPHKKWRNSWDLYPQFFRKNGSFTQIEDFWICEKVWFGLVCGGGGRKSAKSHQISCRVSCRFYLEGLLIISPPPTPRFDCLSSHPCDWPQGVPIQMQGFWNKFKGCTLVGQYIMDRQDKKTCFLLKELNEVSLL